MNSVLMTLMIFFAALVIAWAIRGIVRKIYNIITLFQASHYPDVTKQQHGIVYNEHGKDGERLEADQSTITPF
jgi:hypothetical protein